ncbi:MAG: hypothetical protein ACREU7_07775, partial [Burkholderiales bacterium]
MSELRVDGVTLVQVKERLHVATWEAAGSETPAFRAQSASTPRSRTYWANRLALAQTSMAEHQARLDKFRAVFARLADNEQRLAQFQA